MTKVRTTSLAARLTRMNLLVSGTVLVLAALAFFSFDMYSFRKNLIAQMKSNAQIIGDTAVTAMLFNDPQSAEQTLGTLHNAPNVTGATLRTMEGTLFARYGVRTAPKGGPMYSLPPDESDHVWPTLTGRIVVAHRLMFQGKAVGTVYIIGSLAEIRHRAGRYSLIAGLILLLCLGASVLISSLARRLVTRPVSQLAETALTVSREQDYSVRAMVDARSSEMEILVNAFNAMLSQIQLRDEALLHAHDELEQRVDDRTAELITANRELEAFSYTVAHDLRGPLDSVSSIVYLLSQGDGVVPEGAKLAMLEQLKASTSNMGLLIDDLLNFARASTTAIRQVPVDLSVAARGIVAELHASAPGRDVHFVIAEMEPVETDAGLVRIVLDNLLRNAWKYTSHHEAAVIEFGVKVMGEGRVFYVRDDGAGFDPKRQDALFKPFQRLHSKGEFPGTGIGLATVQRILARLGGQIWAEGAVEVGAAFYFTLEESSRYSMESSAAR